MSSFGRRSSQHAPSRHRLAVGDPQATTLAEAPACGRDGRRRPAGLLRVTARRKTLRRIAECPATANARRSFTGDRAKPAVECAQSGEGARRTYDYDHSRSF
jgi:hypothetical protein